MLRYISLFSGIGGFEAGLHREFPNAECAGFSEIDPWAVRIYRNHFPAAPPLGSVVGVHAANDKAAGAVEGPVDLVFGGSPCQNLSRANQYARTGLAGEKSSLFFEMLRVIRELRPRFFVVENVSSMGKKERDAFSAHLGVEPVMLDAAACSGQRRRRLFWANFPITPMPETFVESWRSILLPIDEVEPLCLTERALDYMGRMTKIGKPRWEYAKHYDTETHRSITCTAVLCKGVPHNVLIDRRTEPPMHRALAPVEVERLQGFPDGWTAIATKTARFKALGNAVHVGCATHVFSCLRAHMEQHE